MTQSQAGWRTGAITCRPSHIHAGIARDDVVHVPDELRIGTFARMKKEKGKGVSEFYELGLLTTCTPWSGRVRT